MGNETECVFCGMHIEVPAKCLKLFHKPVCVPCEYRLTHLTVYDELYGYYKEKIKQMWFPVQD